MTPAAVALVLFVAFSVLAFGWRTVVQWRRHGDTGWRLRPEGIERVVGPMLIVGFVLLAAAPVWALAVGAADRWTAAAVVGAVLAVGAGVLTLVAQVQMGASWRIGVEPGERTDLVTDGLFAAVRNPIFTGMLAVSLGLALLVPNAASIAGAALAWLSIQLQVRLVEEPNLGRVHGDAYRRWTAATGRFVPGLGRHPRRPVRPRPRHA